MNIQAEKIELAKLILETESEQTLRKVKNILKPSKRIDETERILSNPARVQKLEKSIRQAEEGKTRTITLDEIWK